MLRIETSWLDFKLGVRMLIKHPVLTVIGVVAISVAIGMSAAYFEIVTDFSYPALPFHEGARVITIQNEDLETASPDYRSLHDFVAWRDGLKSVRELGVLMVSSRNLGAKDRPVEPVEVVEISAPAFAVPRIAPLLGRGLIEEDQRSDAAPVVVIGERLWESRFDRDPGIVGQTVEISRTAYTIVGVMPKTFSLPVNQSLWIPFRRNVLDYKRRQGPAIRTIGRLAPGASLKEAQAELTVLAERLASQYPDKNARLRSRIMPYLKPFSGDSVERQVRIGANSIFMMLAALICANVGALVFARIATRESELVVRTALGAGRGRIVMQLFAEALVLTTTAAGVALAVVGWGLRRAQSSFWSIEGVAPPFWQNDNLNTTTLLYVAALTFLAAVVIGVFPALKFTRGGVEANLRRGEVGGSGMRSRKMSTSVIVAQVALSGALLPTVMVLTFKLSWSEVNIPGIRAEEYLTIRYRTEESDQASRKDFNSTYRRLKERLLSEGGFHSVTLTDQLPGTSNPGRLIEVNVPSSAVHRVRSATVGVDFFETLNAPILAGRNFNAADLDAGRSVVIVNQPFVQTVLGGRNPIGVQVRETGAERNQARGPWYEIVGVVPDLGMSPREPDEVKGLYHVTAASEMTSGYMMMGGSSQLASAAPKLRTIANAVDPGLLVYDIQRLDDVSKAEFRMDRAFYVLVAVAIYFNVFLSAAVTFALMSFTVSQRTREIGIRKALGAGSLTIVNSVFSRAFKQLGLGAGIGAFLSLLAFSQIPDTHVAEPPMILGIAVFILFIGFLSCVAPVLRVLHIEPTQAMREDV